MLFRNVWVFRARWGRILPESEERIEKLVDRSENEPRQNRDFLLHFPIRKTRPTCFDHNFSRSSPIRPSFCTLPELILLSTKQTLNPRKNALSEKKNYRAEPSPRALENSNSLRETKKGRRSAHLSNHVSPLQTSPTQKRKNGPSTTLQTVENGTLVGVLAAHMAANDRRQVRLVFSKGKWPKI